MRIYAVADIHGRFNKMALVEKNITRFGPDVLVVAGDITRFIKPRPTLEWMGKLPLPVLAVRGNTDRPVVELLFAQYPGITSLHLADIVIERVRFTGLSGTALLPFRSKVCLREKRMVEKIEPLVRKDSVLVSHTPPFGVLDKVLGKIHAGSRGLRELVLRKQPALCICGHIHENPGTMNLGKTFVVNCTIQGEAQGAIIDFTEEGESHITMLPVTGERIC